MFFFRIVHHTIAYWEARLVRCRQRRGGSSDEAAAVLFIQSKHFCSSFLWKMECYLCCSLFPERFEHGPCELWGNDLLKRFNCSVDCWSRLALRKSNFIKVRHWPTQRVWLKLEQFNNFRKLFSKFRRNFRKTFFVFSVRLVPTGKTLSSQKTTPSLAVLHEDKTKIRFEAGKLCWPLLFHHFTRVANFSNPLILPFASSRYASPSASAELCLYASVPIKWSNLKRRKTTTISESSWCRNI